MYVPDWMRSIT